LNGEMCESETLQVIAVPCGFESYPLGGNINTRDGK